MTLKYQNKGIHTVSLWQNVSDILRQNINCKRKVNETTIRPSKTTKKLFQKNEIKQ